MKNDNSKNIILDYQDVENKIKRISLEILEDNIDQKNLILFDNLIMLINQNFITRGLRIEFNVRTFLSLKLII